MMLRFIMMRSWSNIYFFHSKKGSRYNNPEPFLLLKQAATSPKTATYMSLYALYGYKKHIL
jgi:hypothetical protein